MRLPTPPKRTTPGFAFNLLERSLLNGLGSRRFGREEIERVLTYFGADPPECVYCGSSEVRRWDHLVPVRRGGETVIGNMVPACAQCDDSKRDLPFDLWVLTETPSSLRARGIEDIDARVATLQAYMHDFGYTARPLAERLSDDERERLQTIRERMIELRADVEALIADYRERTASL